MSPALRTEGVRAARDVLFTGSLASVLSTLALAALTRGHGRPGVSSTNATSHWLYGRRAFRAEQPDLRHSLPGYLIHHLSSLFWATGFVVWRRVVSGRPDRRDAASRSTRATTAPTAMRTAPAQATFRDSAARSVLRATAVSAAAAFVDYAVVPKRLTPGFEAHLPARSIALVYVAFGLGLALGERLLAGRHRARGTSRVHAARGASGRPRRR